MYVFYVYYGAFLACAIAAIKGYGSATLHEPKVLHLAETTELCRHRMSSAQMHLAISNS